MRLQGRRAVVTGGASGIGRATALRLVDEGAEVWIGDIDRDAGAEIAATSNGRIHFQHTDVTDEAAIAALETFIHREPTPAARHHAAALLQSLRKDDT